MPESHESASSRSESSRESPLVNVETDTRSAMAKAMTWASSITSISVMMVVPALGGYYLDQYLGTVALFLFLGMILGIASSGWQLYKLIQFQELRIKREEAEQRRSKDSEQDF